jgi:hypothetical protein
MSDPAPQAGGNIIVASPTIPRSKHGKAKRVGAPAFLHILSLLSESINEPSLGVWAGKSEAVVEGDDHGGELVLSLSSTMPVFSACSTPHQSSPTVASAFLPTLPLPYDDDGGGDVCCRRFAEGGEGLLPQPVPAQWSAKRRRRGWDIVQRASDPAER